MSGYLHQVAIGLGANLNDPQAQIQHAMLSLSKLPHTRLVKASSLYASKPQGPQDQPDYVNAAVHLETALTPLELLLACQTIEQQQGKQKVRHWGERLIDIDILLFDFLVINTPDLTIPHPFMTQRDFVLLPLQEVWPDCLLPDQSCLSDWIAQLPETFVMALSTSFTNPVALEGV